MPASCPRAVAAPGWDLEVKLLAAVDVAEGGAYPLSLCALQFSTAGPTRGTDSAQETAVEVSQSLLREAMAAGQCLQARWVAVGRVQQPGPRGGVRTLDLHTVGRLHLTHTTLAAEKIDLYSGLLHAKAWQCWLQVVYVLPRGADPQTIKGGLFDDTDTELTPARLFRVYDTRFQMEFAFRDAKQHLGLNDSQARSQAQLHFHVNIVFAALFRARLQAERPLCPFSLHQLKPRNFEAGIYNRFAGRVLNPASEQDRLHNLDFKMCPKHR